MSNEKMSADEAFEVLRSLVTPKANQRGGRPPIPAPGAEENRAKAIEFFAALIAERDALKREISHINAAHAIELARLEVKYAKS